MVEWIPPYVTHAGRGMLCGHAHYRRMHQPGGTFFITQVTEHRAPIFAQEGWRRLLREAIASFRERRPFEIDAMVLLPDHWHLLMTLPRDDADYSVRLASIKVEFTRRYLAGGGGEQFRTPARERQGHRGVWQRRFYEHTIRDAEDQRRHLDYIHYNPVRHGVASCPHLWPHSSFERLVRAGMYERDWCCSCDNQRVIVPTLPTFADWAE